MNHVCILDHQIPIGMYYLTGKLGGGWESLVKLLFLSIWQINRLAKRLLIVSTNLNGFSSDNHEWFAKLSHHTVLHIIKSIDYLPNQLIDSFSHTDFGDLQ